MGWILLEAAVALGLAVFIVWFTMGIKRPPPSSSAPASPPPAPGTPAKTPDDER